MSNQAATRRVKLKKAVADLVACERVCRVATAGNSGMPHVVPVCHVLVDGKIYFASEKGALKVRNLKQNPRIAVSVDIYSDAWAHLRGVLVQGRARLVEKGPRFRRIRGLLYRKYSQYPRQSAIGESDSVIIEVTPTGAFSWGID